LIKSFIIVDLAIQYIALTYYCTICKHKNTR